MNALPKAPLHVAMAIPWPSWNRAGGAERHVHELATALVALITRVTVLVPGPADAPSGLPYEVQVLDDPAFARWRRREDRASTFAQTMRQGFDRAFNRAAEAKAVAIGANVLHRHFGYAASFRPAVPLVLTVHNGILPIDEPVRRAWARLPARLDQTRRMAALRKSVRDADCVICVSEHVARALQQRLACDRGVRVVGNGCPYPAPTMSKQGARARLGLGQQRVVLFIGHLWRFKRVERLLALLDEADCLLVLIGTGELEASLRARATTQPRLRLLGYVDEDTKRLWLRAADVLALPSGEFEGNPIVMMEALRSGTPVYGTHAEWLPAELRPFGRFGDDVRLAFEAMRIDASAAARLVPSWDDVARKTIAVYEEALAALRAKA